MADESVTLVLEGDVPLADFARAIASFDEILTHLSTEVAREPVGWVVDQLAVSSAIITAQGSAPSGSDAPTRVASAYLDLGRAINRNDEIDWLPDKAVVAARGLRSLVNGRITAIRFETSEDEVDIGRSYNQVAVAGLTLLPVSSGEPRRPPALGVVEGLVQTVSNRRGLRFTLFDTTFDRAISCYLARGQEDLMREVWGRRVQVQGLVSRDSEKGKPLAIRQVSTITVLPDPRHGAFRLARGVLPSIPGDAPAEQQIRRVRDAWS